MNTHKQGSTVEYINEFLYFVIRPDEKRGEGVLIYCSGVNIFRFLPLTRGRHGQDANPAFRGLQILNHGLRTLVLSKGATPKTIRGTDCAGIAPTQDHWYTELLLIENAPESLPDEIINYCPMNFLKKIFNACMFEVKLPEKMPEPFELQTFIESLCVKYGRNKR